MSANPVKLATLPQFIKTAAEISQIFLLLARIVSPAIEIGSYTSSCAQNILGTTQGHRITNIIKKDHPHSQGIRRQVFHPHSIIRERVTTENILLILNHHLSDPRTSAAEIPPYLS
ncbi:MAG: hypothetical protein ACLRWQ_14210 [Flavonifractor plautii]